MTTRQGIETPRPRPLLVLQRGTRAELALLELSWHRFLGLILIGGPAAAACSAERYKLLSTHERILNVKHSCGI